ncbi:ribonuclease Z [Candidatus Pacearchaeota archaeon]|nr:ribonuclease Z [Candidatus Pacearchaeota archaeon]
MTSKIKLVFLGTSAQIPTVKRNHPAMVLTYGGENILIDCGEGTQRQFRKARMNPCKVDRILITHRHGDHVFGLPGLISTFDLSGYNKTLYIYGPKGIKRFLENFLGLNYVERDFEIKIEEVVPKGMTSNAKGGGLKFFETDDFYLEAEKMEHSVPTNAYCFVKKGQRRIDRAKLKKSKLPSGPILKKLKQGKDIVYEGKKYLAKNMTYTEDDKKVSFVLDTLNNKKIVAFVKDSDLLVCEASFDEGLKDMAKERLHLTAKQAGEIAKKSKSKKLILTHISQRYEKDLKKLLSEAKKVFKETSIAEDFDKVEV